MIAGDKEGALAAIAEVARAHGLTPAEVAAHLRGRSLFAWLPRVGAYLGAAFLTLGFSMLLDLFWGDMGNVARVGATYGLGIALFAAGLATRSFLATPLLLASAAFQPSGMFVFLDAYVPGDDPQAGTILVSAVLAAQYLAALARRRDLGVLLFLGVLFGASALGLFADWAGVDGAWVGVTLGAALLAVGERVGRGPHHPIAAPCLALGAAGLMAGVHDLVEHSPPWDLAGPLAAIALIALAVRLRSRTLVITAIPGLLCFLIYFTSEYFAGALGWPVAILLAGGGLVAAAAVSLRLLAATAR